MKRVVAFIPAEGDRCFACRHIHDGPCQVEYACHNHAAGRFGVGAWCPGCLGDLPVAHLETFGDPGPPPVHACSCPQHYNYRADYCEHCWDDEDPTPPKGVRAVLDPRPCADHEWLWEDR